jgi:hypothetical protein
VYRGRLGRRQAAESLSSLPVITARVVSTPAVGHDTITNTVRVANGAPEVNQRLSVRSVDAPTLCVTAVPRVTAVAAGKVTPVAVTKATD